MISVGLIESGRAAPRGPGPPGSPPACSATSRWSAAASSIESRGSVAAAVAVPVAGPVAAGSRVAIAGITDEDDVITRFILRLPAQQHRDTELQRVPVQWGLCGSVGR